LKSSSRVEIALGSAVLLLALVLATGIAQNNENRTLDLLQALSHGRLTIDPELWIDQGHANTVDTAFANGHFYSGGAPGLAFALLPFQVVFGAFLSGGRLVWVLTALGAGVPLALSAIGVRRVVAAFGASEEHATLAALAHALGTIALPFATRLYAHSLVVCCFAWALAFVLERRKLGAAGALAAFAVVCDYNTALVAAALGVFVLLQEGKRASWFALGALGPAVLLGVYHTACFGAPWKTPYDFHADGNTREIVKVAYGFSLPSPRVLLELVFGTRRGWLFSQPVALAGLVGTATLARRDRRALLGVVVAAVVLLANAARLRDWSAGASFGARYTTAALPFVALGYARAFELLGRWRWPLLGASGALALHGATSPWGFDLWTTLDALWIQGPRAGAVVALAGLDEGSLAACVASVIALAVVLPLVALRLGRREPALLGALVLVPFLAGTPSAYLSFVRGPKAVREAQRAAGHAELVRVIASSRDLHEAHRTTMIIRTTGDPELIKLAQDREADLGGR
jgi:hypothetical protein